MMVRYAHYLKKKMEEIQVESKYYLMNGLNAIKTVYSMTI